MIDIRGLYKSFEDKTVLSDINASFENGKTNLIIGQSGSGKTVLMKCIVGLLTPEKGEVLYDGRNLVLMGKKEKKMLRKEMGMIFQNTEQSLCPVRRIDEQLYESVQQHKKMEKEEKKEKSTET